MLVQFTLSEIITGQPMYLYTAYTLIVFKINIKGIPHLNAGLAALWYRGAFMLYAHLFASTDTYQYTS